MSKVKYKPIKSRSAATATLKRFFGDNPHSEELTYDDIMKATGRDNNDRDKNMAWLSNKWPTLKHYEFIRVDYSFNDGPRKFEKVVLLPEGRRALGRSETSSKPIQSSLLSATDTKQVTPESVLQDVKALRQQLPSFEITFDIKPKDNA
jgi:hypothetical protein